MLALLLLLVIWSHFISKNYQGPAWIAKTLLLLGKFQKFRISLNRDNDQINSSWCNNSLLQIQRPRVVPLSSIQHSELLSVSWKFPHWALNCPPTPLAMSSLLLDSSLSILLAFKSQNAQASPLYVLSASPMTLINKSTLMTPNLYYQSNHSHEHQAYLANSLLHLDIWRASNLTHLLAENVSCPFLVFSSCENSSIHGTLGLTLPLTHSTASGVLMSKVWSCSLGSREHMFSPVLQDSLRSLTWTALPGAER